MRGVILRKASVIAEDDRRKIISIMNGELNVKDIHILYCKQNDVILGNHYHTYSEICYCLKGKCHYWLHNTITNEREEIDMAEGDIMIRGPFVTHTCECSEDCVLLDGAESSWIGEDYNHTREILKEGKA